MQKQFIQMEKPKEYYQKLNPNGYTWFCFQRGLHYFSKKIGDKYSTIKCREEQLTNGDIEFMTEHGLTL